MNTEILPRLIRNETSPSTDLSRAQRPNLRRSCLRVIILFSAATMTAFFGRAAAGECPGGAQPYAPHAMTHETCPRIGRMGALKLAVPQHYILGPDFVYEGVDIWNAESYRNRPKEQSFDLPIRYFSIRIRQNNFKPIEVPNDVDDFNAFMNSGGKILAPEKQWVFVQFDYPSVFKKENTNVDMRFILNNYVNSSVGRPYGPPLEKQIENISGLVHYLSPSKPSTETPSGEINELFYDAAGNKRMIYCSNIIKKAPPYTPMAACHHLFYSDDGSIAISINMIRDKYYYITHWKEIEDGVLNTFKSFAVQ